MDWGTVLASAGVSAIVGAVVSLLAVSQTTVRRARAERREAARLAVRERVAPLLAELARYEYLRPPEPRRSAERSHMDDHAAVVSIRRAAADLAPWRRWLADRRCRRVFGDYWTDLARDYPSAKDDGSESLSAFLAASVRDREHDDKAPGPLDGLMQRAYSRLPGDALLRDLRRELRRLVAAR